MTAVYPFLEWRRLPNVSFQPRYLEYFFTGPDNRQEGKFRIHFVSSFLLSVIFALVYGYRNSSGLILSPNTLVFGSGIFVRRAAQRNYMERSSGKVIFFIYGITLFLLVRSDCCSAIEYILAQKSPNPYKFKRRLR